MIISKELLSEVLKDSNIKGIHRDSDYVYDNFDKELSNTELLIEFNTVGYKSHMVMNVHELAHKCKDWANLQGKRGYLIESSVSGTMGLAQVNWYEKGHIDYHGTPFELNRTSELFKSANNNEPEAIFKACEWILNAKDK